MCIGWVSGLQPRGIKVEGMDGLVSSNQLPRTYPVTSIDKNEGSDQAKDPAVKLTLDSKAIST